MATVDLQAMGKAAKAASYRLAALSSEEKDVALRVIADRLEAEAAGVLAVNAEEVAEGRARGLSEALLDRLLLTETRMRKLAAAVRHVAALPDPVGTESEGRTLPNGLRLSRRRVPLGVLGVIYEARPNVTVDIAALALKTGNAVILRGGSETLRSNRALVAIIHRALEEVGLPLAAVQLIESTDRALVRELLRLDAYVDMIIPRGGAKLQRLCQEESTIPVILGGIGINHIYVEASADLEGALRVIENAKVQRPSVCNAVDTLLVERAVAADFLPRVVAHLRPLGVEFRADAEAMAILTGEAGVLPAEAGDFDREWLSLVLGLKVVSGLDEAIAHIRAHGTGHSEAILTNDLAHATRFVDEVDASAVFVNASTRFNDGGQFGLGAEVAISTQKLHARGPMGPEALTTYKWIVHGQMHVRR
jgi:glutamate-5-semialdehyde dehydrogenase